MTWTWIPIETDRLCGSNCFRRATWERVRIREEVALKMPPLVRCAEHVPDGDVKENDMDEAKKKPMSAVEAAVALHKTMEFVRAVIATAEPMATFVVLAEDESFPAFAGEHAAAVRAICEAGVRFAAVVNKHGDELSRAGSQ